jgi:cytochrome c-type protein NapB
MTSLMLAAVLAVFAGQALAAEKVESLRGMTAIKADSAPPESKKWKKKSDPIARDFKQQPPLIPHKSQSFKMNLEKNKCLDCHGPEEYEEAEATLVGESHFIDRDGNQLENIAASRYFCNLCHVEQREAEPLVSNAFKSAKE